jgi:hypothetical protein
MSGLDSERARAQQAAPSIVAGGGWKVVTVEGLQRPRVRGAGLRLAAVTGLALTCGVAPLLLGPSGPLYSLCRHVVAPLAVLVMAQLAQLLYLWRTERPVQRLETSLRAADLRDHSSQTLY